VYDLAVRSLNQVALCKIFKVLAMNAAQPEFLDLSPEFHSEFLDDSQLREFGRDPRNDLSTEFLDAALAKGDECYGVLRGAELVSYSWYSTQPTIASDGLTIHFNSDFIYRYKGFTHPAYRGRRLHAREISRAVRDFQIRGFRGTVAYVESNNFASLRSCYRVGYRHVGNALVLGIQNRTWAWTDRACRDFGCSFRPTENFVKPSLVAGT
jgi:hypothetical protein